jgi:hypothetical protein
LRILKTKSVKYNCGFKRNKLRSVGETWDCSKLLHGTARAGVSEGTYGVGGWLEPRTTEIFCTCRE